MAKRILVTGGAGFIGSNFLELFVPQNPDSQFLNLDALTYAAHPLNLTSLEKYSNYQFKQVQLSEYDSVLAAIQEFDPEWVIHFAAETHVDRSIKDPRSFLNSNVVGTFNLLEACRQHWGEAKDRGFLSVSTDEVFGSLGDDGLFDESTAYDPSSPYSASKASADHFVRAYSRTYGLPVKLTNCSNNFGPRQFPEKLIPLMILNAMSGKRLPVYGEGKNVRDWLYVSDHCRALWQVAEYGNVGETYCIGGGTAIPNIKVVETICDLVAEHRSASPESLRELITFVADRPGHDYRYEIDNTKISSKLGWKPETGFEEGLRQTIKWYADNTDWVSMAQSGEYLTWMKEHYDGA